MNISQKAIKVASVFSGIGSPEFALLRANIPHKLIFACDNGEIECLESDDIKGGTLENFYLKPKEGSLFFWDLTDKYKEAYPQVTKVELVWAAAQHF